MFRGIKSIAVMASLGIGLFLIYGQHFYLDQLIKYDDPFVVVPIQKIDSFSQYVSAVQKGVVPDLQPVRDLSIKINYLLEEWCGRPYFHQTNVLLFLIALLGIYFMLSEWFPRSPLGNVMVLHLIAFSPLYVSSVAWITARKHLLALMFIVWATWFLLRYLKGEKRAIWGVSLMYAFSLLSHPMNIMWPVVSAIALLFFGSGRKIKVLFPSFLIALVLGLLNLKYYSSSYEFMSGGHAKFADVEIHGIDSSLLMLGRYVFQTFIPYWTSVGDYGFDSWQNLVGLGMIPVFFGLIGKAGGRRMLVLSLSGFILLLFPVVARITQHSGNDTYLLTGSIFLVFCAYHLFQERMKQVKLGKGISPAVMALLVIFLPFEVAYSRSKAWAWSDSLLIFKQAYEVEPSYPNQFSYAETLFFRGQYDKAFLIIKDLHDSYGMSPHLDGLIARLIIESPDFSDQQRLGYFDEYKLKSRVARILRASIESRVGEYQIAFRRMSEAIEEPFSLNVEMLRCDWIEQQWIFACQKAGVTSCEQLKIRFQGKCAHHP